jgi:uncharacterized protein
MEIQFTGGANEVGRSAIIVKSEKAKILLDAGVKLGKKITFPIIEDRDLRSLDGIFVSHAHLDHCGYLPHIFSAGYKGKVYATKPTIELVNVLINDYMHISKPKDVTKDGLDRLAKSYETVEFGNEIRFRDLRIRYAQSGHILGSSIIRITDGKSALVYTGDINLKETKLLAGADLRNVSGETLIMESTYGAKKDVFNPKESIIKMQKSIGETLLAGGKVVIPSFAVGRAQEILLILGDYMRSGAIPKVPIYIDGMINKGMRIHRHNVIYCRKELRDSILMDDYDPFKNENFVPIETIQDRKRVVSKDEAAIIVTTSGMLTGGPIMFYLPAFASNPMNRLMLVGYQGQGTLGREIQDGAKEVVVNRRKVQMRMKVETYHLSAHADRPQLEALPTMVKGLKRVLIMHGEAGKSEELREALSRKYEAIVPKMGDKYSI